MIYRADLGYEPFFDVKLVVWRVKPQLVRTRAHGNGTRDVAQGKGVRLVQDHTTIDVSLAQSIGPVMLGQGKSADVDILYLIWPDGEMQCELNIMAEKRTVTENNRKTGSCPALFTWNGDRFVCIATSPAFFKPTATAAASWDPRRRSLP